MAEKYDKYEAILGDKWPDTSAIPRARYLSIGCTEHGKVVEVVVTGKESQLLLEMNPEGAADVARELLSLVLAMEGWETMPDNGRKH